MRPPYPPAQNKLSETNWYALLSIVSPLYLDLDLVLGFGSD